ncbi:hypothetical protein EVAR_82490_1 [Eumeta japonica]|uniref:Uncharacterized protein n=1 Tax=Eumeta variegata TaxID=151549 RepID=A0A4C1UWE0_EUMVA|nr:hypothetical protein EVAR_82490_1 [Eumeta japonica]
MRCRTKCVGFCKTARGERLKRYNKGGRGKARVAGRVLRGGVLLKWRRVPKDRFDFVLNSTYNHTTEVFPDKVDVCMQPETRGCTTGRRMRNTYDKLLPQPVPLARGRRRSPTSPTPSAATAGCVCLTIPEDVLNGHETCGHPMKRGGIKERLSPHSVKLMNSGVHSAQTNPGFSRLVLIQERMGSPPIRGEFLTADNNISYVSNTIRKQNLINVTQRVCSSACANKHKAQDTSGSSINRIAKYRPQSESAFSLKLGPNRGDRTNILNSKMQQQQINVIRRSYRRSPVYALTTSDAA